MVDPKIEQFAMHDEDMAGYSVGDVACISCRPLCTNKVIRRYHGGPLFMCKRKEATVEVLAREFARMHPDGVDELGLSDEGPSEDLPEEPKADA